ncbi:hypothetical protein M758_UG166500 [Ceratodon purpureus]|nr:hypothetical protein M758_UG166500 [Ceratodon purpureus]
MRRIDLLLTHVPENRRATSFATSEVAHGCGGGMDNLVRKIQELERDAQTLLDQEKRRRSPRHCSATPGGSELLDDGCKNSPVRKKPQAKEKSAASQEPDDVGDGDWLREFKTEAGKWTGKKLVVMSLFDGIGGVWAALKRMEIPFDGYSSEVSAPAVEVVKARFPEVKHLGDVTKLQRSAIRGGVDLLVGGFPCQDLSCMGKREGLHGQRSRLFFDLLEAMKAFQPKWFLVENVASMSWIDRLEISKYLGVRPLELDSIELTPTRRRRLYWTNIPHPSKLPQVRDHPSTSVQSCLQNAVALEQKTGVVLSTNFSEGNSCQLELVMDTETQSLRYIKHNELELLMGYPSCHTGVLVNPGANSPSSIFPLMKGKNGKGARGGRKVSQGDGENVEKVPLKAAVRWQMLGNTFSVQVIAYLLSPLLNKPVRDLGQRVEIPWSTAEEECSVMEVDDIWALFNEDERPNWYAVIVRRTGDRFSKPQKADPGARIVKLLPLFVEMQYLELTPAYSVKEADRWNPLRGTGVYEARKAIDTQDSWTYFSHRVTSFIQADNKVLIFPGKDEVWTVYCQKMWSPFFVYVKESTMSLKTLDSVRPSAEGFMAKCYLVIKTREHEIYRITEKVLELKDLSVFCFQVPYLFKQQANLLKIELGTGGRKNKKVQAKVRKTMKERKRRREDKGSSSNENEEVEEDKESKEFGELAQDVADASETPLNSAEEQSIELEIL